MGKRPRKQQRIMWNFGRIISKFKGVKTVYKRIAQSIAGDFEYLYDKSKEISEKKFGIAENDKRADDFSDLRSETLKIIEKIDDLERSMRHWK